MYARILAVGLAGALVAAMTLPVFAQAAKPNRISQNNAWGAYTFAGNSGKICYILSIPTQKEPADRDHGDVFFMLAKHPSENVSIEPQFQVGYPFADNSTVTLEIDGKSFSMFTRENKAWMVNPAEESVVVSSMRSGSKMTVAGESRRGTKTLYHYSLSGVTKSLEEIQTCQ